MGLHGGKIMSSIRPILENDIQAPEVKEQVIVPPVADTKCFSKKFKICFDVMK